MTDTLRGIALMIVAMAAFAMVDLMIKLLAGSVPMSVVVFVQGLGGFAVFATITRVRGERLWSPVFLEGPVVLRNIGEAMAGVGIVAGVALSPLSTASAIMQLLPLLVVLGAALFLGEDVGWRRWASVIAGLIGVIVIIEPWKAGVNAASLLVVFGTAGLAMRDVATRVVRPGISTYVLASYAFIALILTGAVWMLLGGGAVWPAPAAWMKLALLILFLGLAIFFVTSAMRVGEVSAVAPFRYSRLVFSMLIGIFALGERPEANLWIGAAIIVFSGLYAYWRETAADAKSA